MTKKKINYTFQSITNQSQINLLSKQRLTFLSRSDALLSSLYLLEYRSLIIASIVGSFDYNHNNNYSSFVDSTAFINHYKMCRKQVQEGRIGYLGNKSGPTLASSEGVSFDLFLLVCFASQRLLRIQDTLFAITFVDVAKQHNDTNSVNMHSTKRNKALRC
jgi:hypothetical protein